MNASTNQEAAWAGTSSTTHPICSISFRPATTPAIKRSRETATAAAQSPGTNTTTTTPRATYTLDAASASPPACSNPARPRISATPKPTSPATEKKSAICQAGSKPVPADSIIQRIVRHAAAHKANAAAFPRLMIVGIRLEPSAGPTADTMQATTIPTAHA